MTGGPTGRRRWRRLPVAVAVVLTAVAGAVVGGVVVRATTSTSTAAGCQATAVASRVLPSVVTVEAFGRNGGQAGTGSGEFIRDGGYVLTNNHVIASASAGGSVEVVLDDGARHRAAIVGRDPLTDLAVLRADRPPFPAAISSGDSSTLQVGQPVVVVGAPLGLSGTVTTGIVSALGRTVQVPGEGNESALLVDAVQTDAAINPGNSGGAMVDCDGDLVGVPTAGASVPAANGQSSVGSVGLGFAIPVTVAEAVADELIATGTVAHAYFGVSVTALTPAAAGQLGLSGGLLVTGVQPGGPAAAAGLRAGDIVTAVDGTPAASTDQLTALAITRRAGDTVTLTVDRDGQRHDVTVTLATIPRT